MSIEWRYLKFGFRTLSLSSSHSCNLSLNLGMIRFLYVYPIPSNQRTKVPVGRRATTRRPYMLKLNDEYYWKVVLLSRPASCPWAVWEFGFAWFVSYDQSRNEGSTSHRKVRWLFELLSSDNNEDLSRQLASSLLDRRHPQRNHCLMWSFSEILAELVENIWRNGMISIG